MSSRQKEKEKVSREIKILFLWFPLKEHKQQKSFLYPINLFLEFYFLSIVFDKHKFAIFLSKKKEKKRRPREFWDTTSKRKNTSYCNEKEEKWEWGTDFAVQKFHTNSNIDVTSDTHDKQTKNRIIKKRKISILMKRIIRSEEHLTFFVLERDRDMTKKMNSTWHTKYRYIDGLIAQRKENTVCWFRSIIEHWSLLELQALLHSFSLDQMYQVNYYFHHLLT